VPDHRIRLRGGWESSPVGAPANSERLTLPTRWDSEQPGRLRLTRRFGCPPRAPGRQFLLLILERVPGVHSIRLNEHEIPDVSPDHSNYEIPLDDLPPRNVLVLEVDPSMAHERADAREAPAGGQGPEGSSDWGWIALVIQSPPEDMAPAQPA
jgi:hypothetical protein